MVSTTSDRKDEQGHWLKLFLDRLGHKAWRRMCPLGNPIPPIVRQNAEVALGRDSNHTAEIKPRKRSRTPSAKRHGSTIFSSISLRRI